MTHTGVKALLHARTLRRLGRADAGIQARTARNEHRRARSDGKDAGHSQTLPSLGSLRPALLVLHGPRGLPHPLHLPQVAPKNNVDKKERLILYASPKALAAPAAAIKQTTPETFILSVVRGTRAV